MYYRHIITIVKNMFSKELPKPMGRWRVDHSNIQINNKIDLSNQDHCGPWGQYAKIPFDETIEKNQNKNKKLYVKSSRM